LLEVLVSCAVLFALDQWSKRFVASRAMVPADGSGARIRAIRSTRRYYSSGAVHIGATALWITAFLGAQFLTESGLAFYMPGQNVGLGMALGGAAGNLADIIRSQSVTDFIELGWWPAFNVADIAIVGGLVIAFWPQ
jgi:signal peptidase II